MAEKTCQFLVGALTAEDVRVGDQNEASGGREWEVIVRKQGYQIIYEAACWHPGSLARDIQRVNLLLDIGLLGEQSPYDPQTKLLIMKAIRGINVLNIAWMRRDEEAADRNAEVLRECVFEEFRSYTVVQGPGLEAYQGKTDFLSLIAKVTKGVLAERERYNENRDKILKGVGLWFGHRSPYFSMLRMLADGAEDADLYKFLQTVYTPTVDQITRLGRRPIRDTIRAKVYDEETGRGVEVDVIRGVEAYRREGPFGNCAAVLSSHSRPLGHGESLVLAHPELQGVVMQVAEESGPISSWVEFEAAMSAKMDQQGIPMPKEPHIVPAAEGIMGGKGLLYALYGGVDASYFDMSLFAHEAPHEPKTWIKVLKTMFGKIAFFLNIEDTRFPAVLDIERAVKAEFAELPTLLDDRGGTVDITSSGVEAAAVKTGRRTREDIERGGRTLEGMVFVVAGSGTAGGELIEKLAERGATVICTDSKGGLNKERLLKEAASSDALRAAKAEEKLALLKIEGVEESEEGEDLRDIVLRLWQERRSVDGIIDLSGDANLGAVRPKTGKSYETSTARFLAEHMSRNPIAFALTNPVPGIDVVEFLKHVKELDKADLVDPTDVSKGVRVAVATGKGGTISDEKLAEWYGQVLLDMVNNNFIFPIEARICLDACSALTDEIRAAVVRSYALSAIDRGRVTPDMWNPEHFAEAVKAGILAARNSGAARMIMDHTGKVRWLRTIEQSMQIVKDSMNFFIQMSANPDIRKRIEEVVGCQLFV